MKNTFIYSVVIAFFAISILGCHTVTRRDTDRILSSQPAQTLQNASDGIQNSTDEVTSGIDQIESKNQENALILDQMQQGDLTSEQFGQIKILLQNAASIETMIQTLRYQIDKINQFISGIDDIVPSIQKLENTLREEKEKTESKKDLYKVLNIMFAMGGIAIAGGVVLAFYNPRMGLMVGGIGLVVTTIAAGGVYYLQWIALGGIILVGIGVLVTIGCLIYTLRKGKIDREVALANTKLLEIAKEDMEDSTKKQIFGDGLKPGIADQIQNNMVKKRVSQIRRGVLHTNKNNSSSSEQKSGKTS